MVDPRTQIPIISCLSGAPGFIHLFNPDFGRIGGLEITNFNRISQKCKIDNNLTIKKTLTQQSTRGLDLNESLSRLRMVKKLVR